MTVEALEASHSWTEENARSLIAWARSYGIVLALLLLSLGFSLTTSTFLTIRNLQNIAQQCAEPGLIACGMTVVILVGEFDLSVGAVFGFAGVIAASVANHGGVALAIVAAVAAGVGLGALNGFIVSRLRIQSFVATLATQFVIVGCAIYLTAGTDNYRVADYPSFFPLADGKLLGIQNMAWIALGGFVLVWVVLRRTQFGRQIYAVGGNRTAARVAGVRVRGVVTAAFMISATLAAVAGVLATSDTGNAQADAGLGTEFAAIAAVVIGGTSVGGGRGGVWRSLTAVLLLAVVADGFTLLSISPTYDQLVQGTIILLAIVIDSRLRRVGST